MPRYRLIKTPPGELIYRNGRLALDCFEGLNNGWNWRARKIGAGYSAIVLKTAENKTALEEALLVGFEIPTATAADQVLRSLVALGYAELLM